MAFGRSCVKQDQKCCTLWLSKLILPSRSLLSKLRTVAEWHVKLIVFILTSKVTSFSSSIFTINPKSILYKSLMSNLLPRLSFVLRASFFSPFLSFFSFFIHSNCVIYSLLCLSIIYLSFLSSYFLEFFFFCLYFLLSFYISCCTMTWYLNPRICMWIASKVYQPGHIYRLCCVRIRQFSMWFCCERTRLTRFFLFSCSKATNRLVQVVLQTYW